MLQAPNKPVTRRIIEANEIQGFMEATTTSRKIAKQFGKEHKNVLRDIRNAQKSLSEEFNQLNFELVEYLDKKGEKRQEYILTSDAFMVVTMAYSGEKAMRIKEWYITMFRSMYNWIKDNEIYRISVDSRNKMNHAIKKSGLTDLYGSEIYKNVAESLNYIVFRDIAYPKEIKQKAEKEKYTSIREYIRNEMPKQEKQMKFIEDYIYNVLINYDGNITENQAEVFSQSIFSVGEMVKNF